VTEKQVAGAIRRAGARFSLKDRPAAVEYAVRFLAGFLLARARIFGSCAPFGAAFAGACVPGAAGALAALGAAAGYFSAGSFVWALKYVSAAVLIRAALRVFRATSLGARPWFPPLVVFSALGIVGFVYVSDAAWALTAAVHYAAETFLAAAATYFYAVALAPEAPEAAGKTRRRISLLILCCTLLMSAAAWRLFRVLSVGRTAALLIVLVCAWRGGAPLGAACGTAIGAAMDMASGSAPRFLLLYPLAALVSGLFARRGRLPFLLAFLMTNSVGALWTWEYAGGVSALYEAFAASVVFMALPEHVLAKAAALLPAPETRGAGEYRGYARERVDLTADAFESLYAAVHAAAGGDAADDDPASIFDAAAETVCKSCKCARRCWESGYAETFDVMNNVTPRLLRDGAVAPEDFPEPFAESCGKLPELVSVINAETRTYLTRRSFRARLTESRGAAYNQYADISAVLRSLSDDLGGGITPEPGLERRLQRWLRGAGAEASASVFRMRGGRLRAEIGGPGAAAVRAEPEYLDKLSAVLNVRLCTPEARNSPERLVLLEAEPLCADVGIASLRKSGQTVCGDKGVYFRTDSGLLCALLSDGMGTGEDAADVSGKTVGILERLLRAGVQPETALRILGDLMLLRNGSDTDCATVDLLCLDMFTGDTRVYKCGAAPSYIKKDSSVRRVSGTALPAGLAGGGRFDCTKFRLPPASFAVLVSDGIAGEGGDKWLASLLSAYTGRDPEALARSIVEAAKLRTGGADDMTVLAVRADERP